MATTRLFSSKTALAAASQAKTAAPISAVQKAISSGFLGNIVKINPGLFGNFGGGGTGSTGGATTSPPSSGGTETTAPSGPSANLQALLAAIPIASDGQVISADYHNSLRSALIAMANQLGMGLTSPTTAYTFAPSFLPIAGAPANWSVNTSLVAVSAAAANPDGWLPVQLPDSQNIQGMTVTGKLTPPAPTSFAVTLFRESVAADGGTPTQLITIALQGQSGVYSMSGEVTAGSAPANSAAAVVQQVTAQDLKLIDTSNYKYFLRATVTGAGTGTIAQIDAIQILIGS